MAESGFVYAKFFSNDPCPDGYSIEELAPGRGESAGDAAPADARRFPDAGHVMCELRQGRALIARFWMGRGGTCIHGGTEYRMPEGMPYIFGIDFIGGEHEEPRRAGLLRSLLTCFQARQAVACGGRLVLCAPAALSEGERQESGLYHIATYDSLSPAIRFRPVVRNPGLAERAVYELRTRASPLAVLAARILSASRLRRYLIEGKLSSQTLRISFNGPAQMAKYYAGIIFSGSPGRVRPMPIGMMLDRGSIDIEAGWYARSAASSPGGIVLPSFSRSILDIGPSFESFVDSLPKSAKSDISKFSAAGFEPFVSREFMDFLIFYHSMYLPMLSSRHHEHSMYMCFAELAELFRRGSIIFVKRGNSPLAGMVIVESEGRLLAKVLGVSAGSYSHTKEGANSAVVFHMIEYSYRRGLKTVDFGYSSPFGCDGVLKFKKKWGTKEVADRNSDLLCLSFRDEEVKRRFFSACAPITLDSVEPYDPA